MTRLRCLVPHCRCSRGDRKGDPLTPSHEWICGKHFNQVPLRVRRRRTKFLRMYRRRFGRNAWHVYRAGSPNRIMAVRLERLVDMAWRRIKAVAIERAVGIA